MYFSKYIAIVNQWWINERI